MQTSDWSYLHSRRARWGNFTLCKHELWPLTNTRPAFPSHTQVSARHSGGNVDGKNPDLSTMRFIFSHVHLLAGPVNKPERMEEKDPAAWAFQGSASETVHRSVNTTLLHVRSRLAWQATPLMEEGNQIIAQGHISNESASNLKAMGQKGRPAGSFSARASTRANANSKTHLAKTRQACPTTWQRFGVII